MGNLNCPSQNSYIILLRCHRKGEDQGVKSSMPRYLREVNKQAEASVESTETLMSIAVPLGALAAHWLCLLPTAHRLSKANRESQVAHKTDRGSQTWMQAQLRLKPTFILLWGIRVCFHSFSLCSSLNPHGARRTNCPFHIYAQGELSREERLWRTRRLPEPAYGQTLHSHLSQTNIWAPQNIQYIQCFDQCPCVIIMVFISAHSEFQCKMFMNKDTYRSVLR